jgi:hypothetical protein
MRTRTTVLSLLAGLTLAACDSPTATDRDAQLQIQLTDAPADYLASAVVEIGRIEILPADGGPAVVVVQDAGSYDLLDLQNGVTADLGAADIESGQYAQLRMVVQSAQLTLAQGYQFTDGTTSRTVFVPSGEQTGIKINLTTADGDTDAGVEIRPGETILVVDFDVSQNFVMQGDAESPAGIQGYLFTPTLRAVVRDVAGSIAGSVVAPDGVTLEGLQVTATRDGAEEAAATTLVKEDGTYLLPFMAPGTYTVTVVAPEGHTANSQSVTVGESQDVTGVELTITAS